MKRKNNILISNQEQYETELFLKDQLERGFNPRFMISFHYLHPSEMCWRTYETKNAYGFGDRIGFRSIYGFWNEVEMDKGMESRRNDYDCIIEDTYQIKNVLLKSLYGIKRLDKDWKNDLPNLFFFHEKGKTKLQYHTHLLMPETKVSNDINDLYDIFNTSIRKKRKCFSKWKRIHIREIDSPKKALSYLNKETNKFHNSLDYENSIFILPKT